MERVGSKAGRDAQGEPADRAGRAPEYRAAGVDNERKDAALAPVLGLLRETWKARDDVLLDIGHFANVIKVGENGIAISTDNVGTKVLIAQLMGKYDTIGVDCIAVNVNDVLCVGAEPLSMVDYIAVERVNEDMLDQIGLGLADGARTAGISLVGGETAQVPDIVKGEDTGTGFDLSGTCIGQVDPDAIISGSRISPRDSIIGLRSSGIHSNGLTLARRVFGITSDASLAEKRQKLARYYPELGRTLGEELLEPTRIYVSEVMEMLGQGVDVRGLAHISADGFLNLARLSSDVGYVIDNPPEPQPIFDLVQSAGSLPDAEMFYVFNMGTGLCAVVPQEDAGRAVESCRMRGTEASVIGHVTDDPERSVEIVPAKLRGWHGKGFDSRS